MNTALHRQLAERSRAFTLLELLMVLAIIGLLTGMTLPFLKGLNQSNTMSAATRQLLDDVGYARHKAIAGHTTVFMLFIPPAKEGEEGIYQSLNPDHPEYMRIVATGQATTYSYFSRRSLGDQPGDQSPDYITKWYSLPQGTFIPVYKFLPDHNIDITVGPVDRPEDQKVVNPFRGSLNFPVPATNGVTGARIPYIAFDYLGRLVDENGNPTLRDEYIPVAQGSIFFVRDASGNPTWAPADIRENPPTNSYNLIHIDALTGRAKIEQLEISKRK